MEKVPKLEIKVKPNFNTPKIIQPTVPIGRSIQLSNKSVPTLLRKKEEHPLLKFELDLKLNKNKMCQSSPHIKVKKEKRVACLFS